jgi:hypothetical protein
MLEEKSTQILVYLQVDFLPNIITQLPKITPKQSLEIAALLSVARNDITIWRSSRTRKSEVGKPWLPVIARNVMTKQSPENAILTLTLIDCSTLLCDNNY